MILGRTHLKVAPIWFRPSIGGGDPHELVKSMQDRWSEGVVIDISTQPALWGGLLRDSRFCYLSRSSRDIESARNEKHAADLLEAHLIETLSSIGRSSIEFYTLRVRSQWEESALTGAISALESARQDGMIGCFGLCAEGPVSTLMAMWQFHDAFDFLVCDPESLPRLEPTANARRVGIIVESAEPVDHVQLMPIRGGE